MAEQDQQFKQFGKGMEEKKMDNSRAGEPSPGEEPGAAEKAGPVSEEGAVGWEQERRELVEQLQRERANFDNFRRISRQQQINDREYALFDFFKKLLPVIDDLERALQSAYQDKNPPSHLQGLKMIYKQLLELLYQEGVTKIEAEGSLFDPNFHHAVAQVESKRGAGGGEGGAGGPGTEVSGPEGESREKTGEGVAGVVAEEISTGYTFKDRILRPSMVKVYK